MKNKHFHPSAKSYALGLFAAAAFTVGNSAQAAISSIDIGFAGTFNATSSFLGGDTTDWSTLTGVFTIYNLPSAQAAGTNGQGQAFWDGVAELSLTFRDSSNNVIGSVASSGLDWTIIIDDAIGGPNGIHDDFATTIVLPQAIGGLAAGRLFSISLTNTNGYLEGFAPLDTNLLNLAGQETVASFNDLGNSGFPNLALPLPRFDVTVTSFTVNQVPEPSSLALLGFAGLGLLRRRR